MANSRLIRQNFFNHPLIAQNYNVRERYFLIGLACASDDFGRFWFDAANLKSTIFPTDKAITLKWITKCMDKMIADSILCHYKIDKVDYAHFPSWFERGWFLKQRIDHPREFTSPDCPMCLTERKTRNKLEISRTIKENSIKNNTIDGELNIEEIKKRLSSSTVVNDLVNKYPLIVSDKYMSVLDTYIDWVDRTNAFDRNHEREFEGRLIAEQEKLEIELEKVSI